MQHNVTQKLYTDTMILLHLDFTAKVWISYDMPLNEEKGGKRKKADYGNNYITDHMIHDVLKVLSDELKEHDD